MEALKRTSTQWYNAIRSQLDKGRAVFSSWWRNVVPQWVKNTVITISGGLSVNGLYDALLWVFGLI